jgi:hypothetical protein
MWEQTGVSKRQILFTGWTSSTWRRISYSFITVFLFIFYISLFLFSPCVSFPYLYSSPFVIASNFLLSFNFLLIFLSLFRCLFFSLSLFRCLSFSLSLSASFLFYIFVIYSAIPLSCLFFCLSVSSSLSVFIYTFLSFSSSFLHFTLGRSWNTVSLNRAEVFYFIESVIHLTGQLIQGSGPFQGLYLHKIQEILWVIEAGREFLSSINNKSISIHYFQETTSVPILHGLFKI